MQIEYLRSDLEEKKSTKKHKADYKVRKGVRTSQMYNPIQEIYLMHIVKPRIIKYI